MDNWTCPVLWGVEEWLWNGCWALAAWYREHLDVPVDVGQGHAPFASAAAGEQTVWSLFPANTSYFGPGPVACMINHRVVGLDAMLAQLRAAGANVKERVEDCKIGRFGWATDPEGNRFELAARDDAG